MDFITGVVRIMRIEGIIRGDDDAPSDFTSSQHGAAIELAKIAIQSEINRLRADRVLPYEITEPGTGTITTVPGQRVYPLAVDFVRFTDDVPLFVEQDASGNALSTTLSPYRGGESALRMADTRYREVRSEKAIQWYEAGGNSKSVGLYQVPDSAVTYRYYYRQSVRVTDFDDILPFVLEEAAETFIEAAARRFKYLRMEPIMREQLFPQGIDNDAALLSARAACADIVRQSSGPQLYGRRYG